MALRDSTQEIIVSFRGTATVQNWLDDLDMTKVIFPYAAGAGYIHRGFLNAYQRVRTRILNVLGDLIVEYPTYSVVFVGHSLAGAVATIAAGDTGSNLGIAQDRIRLVTFASPRVGDAKFSAWITQNHIGRSERIVQENDIVPHLPPLIFGFVHPEDEQYVFQNREVYDCNGIEDWMCSNSRVPFLTPTVHAKLLDFPGDFFGTGAC